VVEVEEQKMKRFEELTFAEVIKHLSEFYIEGQHNKKECAVCSKAKEILNNHDFSLTKYWDYDD